MKTRASFRIVLCLLLAAGAWLFWRQPHDLTVADTSAKKQNIAAHTKILTPNLSRTTSASTAPQVLPAALVSANSAQAAASAKTNKFAYRLTNTKKTIGELTDDRQAILLENALIDTGVRLNFSIPTSLQSQGDPGAYIVQANGPIDGAFRAMLADAGAQIISYIPNNAYLVRASAGGADRLTAKGFSVISYEPYYKVQSSLLGWVGKPLPAEASLVLGLFADNAPQTIAAIEKAGGRILSQDGDIVRVQPPADWTVLAQLSGVHIVEPFHKRVLANDLARVTLGISTNTITATNYLGLNGSNVIVEVNDTGVDASHPDLTPTSVFGDAAQSLVDTNGHGTHVAGVIASSGINSKKPPGPTAVGANARGSVTNADFRGKAPLAKLYSIGFLTDDTNEVSDRYLQESAAKTNALISNNSWGRSQDGEYDLSSASYDAAVRDALPQVTGSQPVLFVFAAGNGGNGDDGGGSGDPDTIVSPGTAKNVITVGALEQVRNITNIVTDLDSNTAAVWLPQTDSRVQVAGYSARGNVGIGTEGNFGRFKPDVVAPGSFVVSTRSGQWDTNAYYNPTNDNVSVFFTIVESNSFSDPNDAAFFVFKNAVQVTITAVNISSSSSADLPIYVWPGTDPNAAPPVLAGTNFATIPAVPSDIGWSCSVSNLTTNRIIVELIVDVQTTNDLGNYYSVLQGLNETLAPYYRYESGTSIATPAISGVLALMQDYFTNTLHLTPSPALLKAMLINGSRAVNNYKFAVTNAINFQGWGLANLTNSLPIGFTNQASTACSTFFLDQSPTNALATGDSHTFLVTVTNAALGQPLRATLVWTDPAGDPVAAIKLVNNLDLVITNLSTTNVYYGNNFSLSGNPPFSLPANTNGTPAPDSINNVENIFLSSAVGTNFSVTVVGREVNVNAVTAHTNNVVQDFALVISSGNGTVTNALTVTDAGVSSQPTSDQLVTFVMGTNTPLLNQLVGASTPLLGTNTIQIMAGGQLNGLQLSGSNVIATIGMTNQWHFYVVTNKGASSDFTNAAFITFFPSTLSIPRMGVYEDSTANATRPEADIDMFVSQNPALTNLDPTVLAAADKSLGRSGTEFVAYTNSSPGQVYYVGIKSEDQYASEFGFISIFTRTPFSQMRNGNQIVNGLLLPVSIPDGSPAHPGVGLVFALALQSMEINSVVVSNQITHQNFGDLVGVLNHNGLSAVLNNHDSLGNPPGPYNFVYDDSGQGRYPGSQPSDGPGGLENFKAAEAIGPWIFTEVDDSLTQTGAVTGLTLVIQPHRDLRQPGATIHVEPGEFFIDFIDVPVGFTNLTVSATNLPVNSVPPIRLYVKEGVPPTLAHTNVVFLTNCATGTYPGGTLPGNSISTGPPLNPDRYFVGIFNPDTVGHDVFVIATLAFSSAAATTIDFHPSGRTTILDDAVTYSDIFVPNTDLIQLMNVGLRVDHPRISDLVFHLISPDGTRYLLMENRGGTTTNGAGITVLNTNFIPVNSTGGAAASTNTIDTGQTSGSITISYDFFAVPDQMIVQYQGTTIFDSGVVSGAATTNITYGPGSSTLVSIIMNPGGNAQTNTAWQYTVSATQAQYVYLTLTENTNLTTTPIKYAVPPFIPGVQTNLVITNITVVTNITIVTNSVIVTTNFTISTFEAPAAADYVAPATVDGWNVISNQVTVVNDATNAFAGNKYLALANGSITNPLSTVFGTGTTNVLTYAYRGPGVVSMWRGEGNGSDSADGNTAVMTNLVTSGNTVPFTNGLVGQAFLLNTFGPHMYVTGSSNLNFGLKNGFTIEGWINVADVNGIHPICEWNPDRDGSPPVGALGIIFCLGNNPGSVGSLGCLINDTAGAGHGITTPDGTMVANVWQHIGITYNRALGVATIYRNGVVAAQSTLGSFVPKTDTNLWITVRPGDAPGTWTYHTILGGLLDEFSIYGRALSTSEMKAIYTNAAAGKFDAAASFPTNLAKARVTLAGVTNVVFGNNATWQTNSITFVATTNKTPLRINGLEPGMLLDSFAMLQISNSITYITNVTYVTNILITTNMVNVWHSSFEENVPTNSVLVPTGSFFPEGWHVDGGDIEVISNGVEGPGSDAFEGRYYIDLNGSTSGTISTNVATIIGKTYTFSFAYARNPDSRTIFGIVPVAKVLINGTPLATFNANYINTWSVLGWKTTNYVFTATSNTTQFTFQSTSSTPSGMLLDAVNLAIIVTNSNANLFYLPEQSIQPLIGQSAFGLWQLEIQDDRAGAGLTNTLVSWQLEFVFAKTNFSVPPIFTNSPTNQIVNEGSTLIVTNRATSPNTNLVITYSLLVPPTPTNVLINPATGVITWTPNEDQGPGDYIISVIATDNGSPPSSSTNSFFVRVNELNSAPFWPTNVPSQTNYFVNALGTLIVTNTASDTDSPPNVLTYQLVAPPTPPGVTIDTNTGIITWTPTLAQASNTYTITTIVTDTNPPAVNAKSLSATNSFTVTVGGTNSPPVFLAISNQTVDELTTLVVTNAATDPDIPPNTLTYTLLGPPAGMTIDPATAVITWTPDEAQGPGVYFITNVVTDNGGPPLSTTNVFTVTVNEVNLPPVPPNIPDQTAFVDELFVLDDAATDPDIPTNILAYMLLVSPVGMTIDPATGIVSWTPTAGDAGTTNLVTVVVTDNGVPPLSATNSFFVIVSTFTNSFATGIPAFPDAEGAGGFAVGGRGGDVYHVTNLNDSGPGSLRNGVTAAHRTIVFDVSGTINLLTDLKISRSYLTIAGQTAPGDGITTRGRLTSVQNAHDVQVRFLRFRPGDLNCPTFQDDSFHFNSVSNSIADHVSGSWSIDEVLSATFCTNITVQWSVIAEPLNDSCHDNDSGPGTQLHGYGSLLRYGSGALTYHHNLYADNYSRNPRLGDNLTLDFVNNVISDWGIFAGYNENDAANNPAGYTNMLNYIGNYLIVGLDTVQSPPRAFRSGVPNPAFTEIYQTNNLMDTNLNSVLDGGDQGWGAFSGPITQMPAAFTLPELPVTTDPPAVAYERVLDFAGASLMERDTVDSNVVNNVRNQTGHIIDSQSAVGGWPALNSTPTPLDTDQDGMPDFWEITLGFNPTDAADGNATNSTGYTHLEDYLNWLAAPHTVTVTNTPVDVDLHVIAGKTGSQAFSVANGTNGTVTLLGDGHTARFTPTNDYIGLASFTFNVTNTVTGVGFGPVTVSVLVSPFNISFTFPILTNGVPLTNSVPPGGIAYFLVNVPTNADFATNILLFATGPVNLLFNQTNPPTGTNAGDFELLTNSIGDIGSPIFGTNTVPPLIPGSTYYLGVQNTNSFTVTNAIEVDFHLIAVVPPSTNIFISSITFTNIGGTNGFLLIWFAPTNDIFQVQWAPDLTPPVAWGTFSNIITYVGPPTPTNGMFSFFDDGSQTGGVLDPIRFYRLILLQATNTLTLPNQTNYIATVSSLLTVTNTAADSNTNLTLTYFLTNSPVTSIPVTIDTNGVITWTPGVADGGGAFKFTTVVTDNGVPSLSATNGFTVFVVPPFPSISSVTATATNVTLQWTAPTNDLFQVEWATNLTPVIVWTPFPPVITSTTGLFTFTDTNAPLFMKFYRLSWLPLP